ncbi:hypothetical protein EVAR_29662_1 [Eumeta japonica]|uniref:Uncharacterized protein n=1 Tax=Eumeta variegata TaxID=151549 RepID=A0A4C1W951_EUMVA|nr:hypothetical protein EVAR_29662_1 [Eumeta japonica]
MINYPGMELKTAPRSRLRLITLSTDIKDERIRLYVRVDGAAGELADEFLTYIDLNHSLMVLEGMLIGRSWISPRQLATSDPHWAGVEGLRAKTGSLEYKDCERTDHTRLRLIDGAFSPEPVRQNRRPIHLYIVYGTARRRRVARLARCTTPYKQAHRQLLVRIYPRAGSSASRKTQPQTRTTCSVRNTTIPPAGRSRGNSYKVSRHVCYYDDIVYLVVANICGLILKILAFAASSPAWI